MLSSYESGFDNDQDNLGEQNQQAIGRQTSGQQDSNTSGTGPEAAEIWCCSKSEAIWGTPAVALMRTEGTARQTIGLKVSNF